MWQSRGKVAIAGVGFSRLTRRSEGTLGARCIDACQNAVADAGLRLSDIDGLAGFPEAPFHGSGSVDGRDLVTVNYLIQHLDLAPDIQWYAQINQGMVLSAVIEAVNALAAGACKYALVWRALHQPRGVYGAVSGDHAYGEAQFKTPYGFGSIFQEHALAYQRYLDLYGASRQHMATLVVSQRTFANQNSNAYFHDTPMTHEDYLNARMVSDPCVSSTATYRWRERRPSCSPSPTGLGTSVTPQPTWRGMVKTPTAGLP